MCLTIADVARQTQEWGCLMVRPQRCCPALLVATPNNEVRCDLAIVGSARQDDLHQVLAQSHRRPYVNHHEIAGGAHSDSVPFRAP
jgi:hypothetical protein